LEGLYVAQQPLISIVDDDRSLRHALVRLVRSLGYETRGFDSAEEFAASSAMSNSACVITDIQMPGMSGIELKQLLVERCCLVPVIMITARHEQGLEERAHAAGAACFLRKPFATTLLIDCLERALKA
jgi:FixJ family two-component response regulator